ncbi:MAG: glycosyltransferase [Candidatus Riflebacteria bacterium]|nr:glycosyltransferase [Candidatus Riflebacteria bacterium]
MPKISVIMGVYNNQNTVKAAIESIRSQTFTNWEFVICDDGSTDKTWEILQEYATADKRIKLIQNKVNRRLSVALNRCLKTTKGEYIARMDADDIALPERFAKQLDFLENNPEFHACGSAVIIFDKKGKERLSKWKEFPSEDYLLKNVFSPHPTVLMRKSTYDALNGYANDYWVAKGRCEDLDLWQRFAEKGFKIYNIQEPLLKYFQAEEDYYSRYTFHNHLALAKVRLRGYKRLGFPKYLYLKALREIKIAYKKKILKFCCSLFNSLEPSALH